MSYLFKCYPCYLLLLLGLISLFIIIKSYNKKIIKYSCLLSLIMTIFPYIIYKLNLTRYYSDQLIALTGNSLNLRILNAFIIFITEYILYYGIFNLAKILKKYKDNKTIYTIFVFILNILAQIIMWYLMKYLWNNIIKNLYFTTDSWFSLILFSIIGIYFIFRSYEKDEIIYAVPLAIINLINPIFSYNLHFKFVPKINYSLLSILIMFIIQYFMCFINLKISNKFINRNDHKIIYILLFIILNIVLQVLFLLLYALFIK